MLEGLANSLQHVPNGHSAGVVDGDGVGRACELDLHAVDGLRHGEVAAIRSDVWRRCDAGIPWVAAPAEDVVHGEDARARGRVGWREEAICD